MKEREREEFPLSSEIRESTGSALSYGSPASGGEKAGTIIIYTSGRVHTGPHDIVRDPI